MEPSSIGPSIGPIDLNADLGEEVTDDAGLLAVVTSANVACGYHAGNARDHARGVRGGGATGVSVGAQVSYDDRENFGRVARDVPTSCCASRSPTRSGRCARSPRRRASRCGYVKPHGALYHRVIDDEEQARAVLAGSGHLPVLGMPGALILELAGGGRADDVRRGVPGPRVRRRRAAAAA